MWLPCSATTTRYYDWLTNRSFSLRAPRTHIHTVPPVHRPYPLSPVLPPPARPCTLPPYTLKFFFFKEGGGKDTRGREGQAVWMGAGEIGDNVGSRGL